ncbi:peptide chain release factor N(5)-glutamine methyltransferase [Ciceribacter azotifigens]|uniref:peptide chain release factor N(5)-glutamine methyltransferase n=1 Tax=Ciceribacter azotifigens TaxID=2069303 RepID=UPI003A85003B
MSRDRDTASALIAEARRCFTEANLADPATDARVLVAGILGLSLSDVVMRGDIAVCREEAERVRAAVVRRCKHEPVHRILGHRAFYGLDLRLSPATLEPRPDTEILVDSVLPHLKRTIAEKGSARLLDLGVGTGAIALALLKECPQARAVGSDISEEALSTAESNAYINGVAERFETVRSAWFACIDGRFDIIVSNPPYIPTGVVAELDPEVRDYDPLAALDGGEDGLDAYRALAAGAGAFLEPRGLVAVEIGYDQKDSVTALFEAAGFSLLEARRDHGGNDRVLLFTTRNCCKC